MNEDYMDSLRRVEDTDMGLFIRFSNVAVSDGTGTNITTEYILSTDACDKRPVTIDVDVVKTNVVKPVSQEELRQLRTRYFANKKKQGNCRRKYMQIFRSILSFITTGGT